MKKKWVTSVALGGIILLSMPLVGFSAPAKESAQEPIKEYASAHVNLKIQLGSGGIAIPGAEAPKDGIIAGLAGCIPDVHVYHKNKDDEHIVFSASLNSEFLKQEQIKEILENKFVTVYAQVYSGDTKLLELPLFGHPPDPNTGKDFLVTCLFINQPETNLPTGDYTYKFIAKVNNAGSVVISEWVPENNTFTIINDSDEN